MTTPTPLERGGILDATGPARKADRGGGEGNGEEGGRGPAVVRLVVVVVAAAGVVGGVVGRLWWWEMGRWVVMMSCVASWGRRDRRGCDGFGAERDGGRRLLRRGVGWKTVGGGPGGKYGEEGLFCLTTGTIGGLGGNGLSCGRGLVGGEGNLGIWCEMLLLRLRL